MDEIIYYWSLPGGNTTTGMRVEYNFTNLQTRSFALYAHDGHYDTHITYTEIDPRYYYYNGTPVKDRLGEGGVDQGELILMIVSIGFPLLLVVLLVYLREIKNRNDHFIEYMDYPKEPPPPKELKVPRK